MVKIGIHSFLLLCLAPLFGVDVYIMDNGIRTDHEKFKPFQVLSKDIQTGVGDSQFGDHASMMAGLIVDRAPQIRLISVRTLDAQGNGTWTDFLKGIHWITNHHAAGTPAVANLSLGGMTQDTRIQKIIAQSIDRLVQDGVTVVVAAGNEGKDEVGRIPSTLDSVISVGAVSFSNRRLGESNFGSCVDVYVLGDDLSGPSAASRNSLVRESGTSVAAAVLTGHVAAFLRLNPEASPEEVKAWVTSNSEKGKVSNFPGREKENFQRESLLFFKK